jgi:hypothetical protein
MANNTELEAKILEAGASGISDLSLMSQGYELKDIAQAKSVLEKKNPGATASTESGSVEPPLDSLSNEVEPPNNDFVNWLAGNPFTTDRDMTAYSERVYTDSDGKEHFEVSDAFNLAPEGEAYIQYPFEETPSISDPDKKFLSGQTKGVSKDELKNRVIPGRGPGKTFDKLQKGRGVFALEAAKKYEESLKQIESMKLPDGSLDIQAALLELQRQNPDSEVNYGALLSEFYINNEIANDSEYMSDVEERNKKIKKLEKTIGRDQYTDDPQLTLGAPSYAQGERLTAKHQRERDQSNLRELEKERLSYVEKSFNAKRADLIRDVYTALYPEPAKSTRLIKDEGISPFMSDHDKWVEKIQSIEGGLLAAHGWKTDIDKDNITGPNKGALNDWGYSFLGAVQTTMDLGFGLAHAFLPDGVIREYNNYTQQQKKKISSGQSLQYMSLGDEIDLNRLTWDNSFSRINMWAQNAFESSPYTVISLIVAAATKSPGVSVATMTALTALQTYYKAKSDPSFDEFKVNGEDFFLGDDPELTKRIKDYYLDGSFEIKTDENGKEYFELPGSSTRVGDELFISTLNSTRVYVTTHDDTRFVYASAQGAAEGIPEGLGASILLKGLKSGIPSIQRNVVAGILRSVGMGMGIEATQEATTAVLNLINDAAIKGEYVSAAQAAATIIESAGAGAIMGGSIAGGVKTVQELKLGAEGRAAQRGFYEVMVARNSDENLISSGIDIGKAKKLVADISSEKTTAEDKEIAEHELNELLKNNSIANKRLSALLEDVGSTNPALAVAIADAAVQFSRLVQGIESGNLTSNTSKSILDEQLQKAKAVLEELVNEGKDLLVQEGLRLEGFGLEASDVLDPAKAFEAVQMDKNKLAEDLGMEVSEVEELLKQAKPSAVAAAASLAKKGGEVTTYATQEAYLEATGADVKSKARFNNDGSIHLSPNADAMDVMEEVMHREIQNQGLEGSIDDMLAELKEIAKTNPLVAEILSQRETEYEGDPDLKEEMIVGVLREIGVKTDNKDLKKLQSAISKAYKTEQFLSQMSAPMTEQQEYDNVENSMARGGLKMLERLDPLAPEQIENIAQDLGIDLNNITFSQLEQISDALVDASPFTVINGKNANFSRADPQVQDFFQDNKLLFRGRVKEDVAVIKVKFDEVGRVQINGDDYISGVPGEIDQIEQGGVATLLASSNSGTATKYARGIIDQLRKQGKLPEKAKRVVIMYESLGTQGSESSMALFDRVSIDSQKALRSKIKEGGEKSNETVRGWRNWVKKAFKSYDSGFTVTFWAEYSSGKPSNEVTKYFEDEESAKNYIEALEKSTAENRAKHAVDGTHRYEGINLDAEEGYEINPVEADLQSIFYESTDMRGQTSKVRLDRNIGAKLLTAIDGLLKGDLDAESEKAAVLDLLEQLTEYDQTRLIPISIRSLMPGEVLTKEELDAYKGELRDPKIQAGESGTDHHGKIFAIGVGDLLKSAGDLKGRSETQSQPIPRTKRQASQYNHGVPFENAKIQYLKTPITAEEAGLNVKTAEGEQKDNQKRNMFGSAHFDLFSKGDGKKGKDSKYRGIPDNTEVTWIESSPIGYSGKAWADVKHSRVFDTGWDFYNWWVSQTGNGKSDVISRFSYIGPDGKRIFIDNIGSKKDRSTGKALRIDPQWKTWASRAFNKAQREETERMKSKQERTEKAMGLEDALRLRLKESSVKMNMSALDRDYLNPKTLARERYEPTLKYNTFSNPSYMTHLQYMENRLNQLEEMQLAETGATLTYNPSDLSLFDESVFASTTMVGLASKEVKATEQGIPTLKDMNTFFDQYNFLFESTDNVKHSVTKTENGWKLDVNLAVSGSIESLAKEATDVPQSKEGLIEFVEALNNGEKYTPKDSRIMPPRYYQLKAEKGLLGLKDFLEGYLVNKYAPILDLQEEVEKERGKEVKPRENFKEIEQLMYGRSRAAMENLDKFMAEAKDFMIVNKITHTDLSLFMYALHAAERNDVIMGIRPDLVSGSGMSNELAEEILSNLDSPEMRAAAKMFQGISDDTRKVMVEEGLESQARIDAWNDMYDNYVPLPGFAEDEKSPTSNAYPTGGASKSGVYGSNVKKALGRESEAANVLFNIIMQNAATHQQAGKNRTLKSLYYLVSANDLSMEGVMHVLSKENPLLKINDEGEQDHMSIAEMHADPHTVAVRVDGAQKFIYFNDPYYASVLNGMTMEQSNTFIKMLRAPVSFLRGVFTQWNPNFFVGNFARDMGASIYNAEADIEGGDLGKVDRKGFQKQMMSNTWGSLKNLLGEAVIGKEMDAETQQYFDEWREDGGQTGWNYVKELEQIAADLSVEADDLSKGQKLKEKLFSSPKKFLEFVEGVNDAFENSIRLSAYTTARQRGATRQKAAVFSKNITVNFNRSGEAGPTINALYLFFNASIQGNLRVYNSLSKVKPAKRPDGSTREWYERASNPQKIAAGMAMFSGMLTLINLALSGKDPEDDELWYNKVSEYDKQRNMIICYGKNRDDFLKIPLPYGFGLFNNAGLTLAETSTGNRTLGEATMFLGTSAFNAFSPISFGGDGGNLGSLALGAFAPTVLKPFVEIAENRTYFGSRITGEQLPFGTPTPNSQLSYRSPDGLKDFWKWMNEATGGSEYKSGDVDINPDYAWYLFEYLVGGTGDFVMDSGKQARNMYEMSKRSLNKAKDSKDLGQLVKSLGYGFSEEGQIKINYNDVPIIKKIYGEASPFYDIENFKKNETEVAQLYREIKENAVINEPGRYKGVQVLYEESKKVNKQIKQIRTAINVAREIEDYIDRQNRMYDLYEEQRAIMARYNKKYKTLRGE